MTDKRALGTAVSMPPVVVGYVEAVTATTFLGWVWCPGRSDKIPVELRIGEETLSRATANDMRDDLAKSGIGDGCHAFALPIPEVWQQRSGELKVFAVPNGVAPIALEPPPAANTVQDSSLSQMQRGMDILLNSQRLIHRNLQAALLQNGPAVTTSLTDVATAQASLQESIAAVELFLVRLEQTSSLHDVATRPATTSRMLIATVGVSASAFVMSCFALSRILFGA